MNYVSPVSAGRAQPATAADGAPQSFRRIAQSLAAAVRAGRLSAVVFTASAPGDGTTTCAIETANQLRQGFRLDPLVVELDITRPHLVRRLGLSSASCLQAVATDLLSLDEAVQRTANGLAVLPARTTGEPAGAPLPSVVALDGILAAAKSRFDLVIVDAPPITTHPETMIAGRAAGHVVLVVAAGRTPFEVLASIELDLADNDVALFGTVLNRHRRLIPGWLYRILR